MDFLKDDSQLWGYDYVALISETLRSMEDAYVNLVKDRGNSNVWTEAIPNEPFKTSSS